MFSIVSIIQSDSYQVNVVVMKLRRTFAFFVFQYFFDNFLVQGHAAPAGRVIVAPELVVLVQEVELTKEIISKLQKILK